MNTLSNIVVIILGSYSLHQNLWDRPRKLNTRDFGNKLKILAISLLTLADVLKKGGGQMCWNHSSSHISPRATLFPVQTSFSAPQILELFQFDHPI
jgi:hypothetical protein